MVLALELADVGIGAAAGAIVSGAVLLILDQRRRSWEKRTRYQDQKRQAYKTFLRMNDLMVSDIRLIAEFWPVLRGWMVKGVDQAKRSEADRLLSRFEENVIGYNEHLFDALTDLNLLAPRSASATLKMAESIGEMIKALKAGQWESEAALENEYHDARMAFYAQAQRDLGVRP